MNTSHPASPEAVANAYQRVATVVNIIEKLHGEGFLAARIHQNLGLSSVQAILQGPTDVTRVEELDVFLRRIDALFEARQLLHPSATEKFQALFKGYLNAALKACSSAGDLGLTRPTGATLH